MTGVEVRELVNGQDTAVARIFFDGQQYLADPPNSPIVLKLLKDSVVDPRSNRPVDSSDPLAFFLGLEMKYRSPYFRVHALQN